jgi:DNA-directed RNA polymerase subunit alpha
LTASVHEHQTIPWVVEDVHQIISNLKTLTLSLADDLDEAILRISKSEAGPITAADVQDQSGVRVIDARHHLFTLQDDRDINVELYVNKGRGYIEADQHVIDRGPSDRPRSHRLDLQPGPPRELLCCGDARLASARTTIVSCSRRDERHDHAGRGGELCGALAQTHFQYFAGFGSHASCTGWRWW